MEDLVREAYDGNRNFSNKTFRSGCYAPFTSLYFNSYGEVLACCKNDTFVLGNIAHQRLNEIWNGDKLKLLRQALANYQFEKGCKVCEWEIMGGNYQGSFPSLFEVFPVQTIDPEWPAQIEFAGSNSCNFECIMCSGELSSSIRSNREGLPPMPKVYSEQFFEDLRKFLPHLLQAKFLGGEPFFTQECFRIWDMMIEDGLTVPCHVTTNGSQFNAKVERVLEALPISLSISVDGVTKETVERIRVNSHYETLIDNLHRFREYAKGRGTYFGLTYCLMQQNWHEFGDFLLFAEGLGCEVFVNTVIHPIHCSLYSLPPPQELSQIVDALEKQSNLIENSLRLNRHVWEENILKLRANTCDSQADKFTEVVHIGHFGPKGDDLAAAWRLFDNGLYREALDAAAKTPASHPFYYQSVALCGCIRHLLGDLEGAELDLDRAVSISRRPAEALLYRARLRIDQSRLTEGAEDALRARTMIKHDHKLEAEVSEVMRLLSARRGHSSEATEA